MLSLLKEKKILKERNTSQILLSNWISTKSSWESHTFLDFVSIGRCCIMLFDGLAKMVNASSMWRLIYLTPRLASSWVLNFLSQHYGKVIEEFMLQGHLRDWFHPSMSVKWKLQLKCACGFPPGGYLDISKMQTVKNSFISGEIWVTFNYVCISLLLLDARTVKCYKKTHLAHNKGGNNSKKGYEMRFS